MLPLCLLLLAEIPGIPKFRKAIAAIPGYLIPSPRCISEFRASAEKTEMISENGEDKKMFYYEEYY